MPGEQLLLINPRRRKRHKNSRSHVKRRRVKNPRRHRAHKRHRNPRHHYRRHRNPVSVSGIKSALLPAAYGAAGAVALDFAYNFATPYIPSQITSIPYGPQLVKIAGAFGIGMLARKFMGSEKGNAVLAGALTVTLYNIAASTLGGTAGMAGLGAYIKSGIAGLGSPNPAVYVNRPMGRLGRVGAYMRPAALSGLPFGGLGSGGGPQYGDYGESDYA